MAANNFTGTTNSNWGTATNWSLGTVPTASDGNIATFLVTSPNCTVDTSARVCNALDFTGYTNTITMTYQISVYGNITLEGTMHVAGTDALVSRGTNPILTSDAFVWPNTLTLVGGITHTLVDNWTIQNLYPWGTGTATVNGNTIYINGNLAMTASTQIMGTTNLVMQGTGTWSANSTSSYIRNNLTINTGNTISGIVYYATGTLICAVGASITTNNSTLNVGTTTTGATFDLNGLTLNNLNINNTSGTITLNSGFVISGAFTNSDSATHMTIKSSLAGTQRIVTLLAGGTQDLRFLDATDIDSSGGLTIYSRKGVLSNATNWKVLSAPVTVVNTF